MEKKILKCMRPLLLVVVLSILVSNIPAQGGSTLIQGFCTGNSAGSGATAGNLGGQPTGGVIPNSDILSGQSNGEQTVLNISLLIMLTMLIIVSMFYMISYVFSLPALKEMAKVEIGEVFITGIIVLAFVGSFLIISSATTSQSYFAAAGSNFGRNLFIDDCGYLATSSVSLLEPFFEINIVRFMVDTISSLKVTLEPTYFGFSVQPLLGYKIFDNVLAILDDMAGAFILLDLGTLLLVGIIYAVFPLFLYAGIILRTIPWTRAAGGAFLGIFIGFYIVFPILLHLMLGGYAASVATGTPSSSGAGQPGSSLSQQIINQLSGQSNANGATSTILNILETPFSIIGGAFASIFNSGGVVGGFIKGVIEPAFFTILAIIVAFMISFDITEAMGDMLGAPSLKAADIFTKGVKGSVL